MEFMVIAPIAITNKGLSITKQNFHLEKLSFWFGPTTSPLLAPKSIVFSSNPKDYNFILLVPEKGSEIFACLLAFFPLYLWKPSLLNTYCEILDTFDIFGMTAYYGNPSDPLLGLGYFTSMDVFQRRRVHGYNEVLGGVSSYQGQSLVLDSEKGELVKAPVRVLKKSGGVAEAKAMAALKNHSQAERRRRERINAHLDTLRGLVPSTDKMDKATLLAEVIKQVKELEKTAVQASEGLLIPMDDDEVKVEPYDSGAEDGPLSFKASVCCNYRPELLSDIRQAIDSLQLTMVNAEVSTLGGRLMSLLFCKCCRSNYDFEEALHLLAYSIKQALSSVLENGSYRPEYSPRTTHLSKRRRISFFESSRSSS